MKIKNIVSAGIITGFATILSISAYANTDFKEKETLMAKTNVGVTEIMAEHEAQEIFIDHAKIYKVAQDNYYWEKFQRELAIQREQERIEREGQFKTVNIPTTSHCSITYPATDLTTGLTDVNAMTPEQLALVEWVTVNADVKYNGIKTYMDYRTITAVDSPQYKLERIDGIYTDDAGFRRIRCQNPYDSEYQDRYVIAVGYGTCDKIGQCVDLVLENGQVIPCIVGDQKAKRHTDETMKLTSTSPNNACASEFIVEQDILKAKVGQYGDCSYYFNNVGVRVSEVRVYNKNVLNK